MDFLITFFAKSDSFLFPGSYYECDWDRLDSGAQRIIKDYELAFKNKDYYIYILNTYMDFNTEQHGVIGKFVYVEDKLCIHILVKATLFEGNIDIGNLVILDNFNRKSTYEQIVYKEIDFLAYSKDVVSYDNPLSNESLDQLLKDEKTPYQVLNFLNHIFPMDHLEARDYLFQHYDYDLYLDIVNSILHLIIGKTIDFELYNGEVYEVIDKLFKSDRKENIRETKIIATNRFVEDDYFYDLEIVHMDANVATSLLEKNEIFSEYAHNDQTLEGVFDIFVSAPFDNGFKENVIDMFSDQLKPLKDLLKKIRHQWINQENE